MPSNDQLIAEINAYLNGQPRRPHHHPHPHHEDTYSAKELAELSAYVASTTQHSHGHGNTGGDGESSGQAQIATAAAASAAASAAAAAASAVLALENSQQAVQESVYTLPLTNVQQIIVTPYDHQLTRIRGVALERFDGQRLAIGYKVSVDLTVGIDLFRPVTGKLLIF